MKRVPNFYRRNAAAGAVRRVLDKKRADPAEARETVEQIVSLCVLMAAVSVMEWNAEQRDEYIRCKICCTDDYSIRAAAHNGQRAAQRWLDSVVEGLRFVLPADESLKRKAAREALIQKRMSSDRAWKLWAAALVVKKPNGMCIDKETAQRVLDEARDYYRDRFLPAVRFGDGYGMETLRRDAENVLGDAAQLALGEQTTVYSNRVW